MIEPRLCLFMSALFSQWVMATVLMVLFIDSNLCVICSVGLLIVDADIALHRLRDEWRWTEYQRHIVNSYDATIAYTDCARSEDY